jgi:hypothetical protein
VGGIGFYSYTPWACVAVAAFLPVLVAAVRDRGKRGPAILALGLALASCLPMALARLEPGSLDYIGGKFQPRWSGVHHLAGWFMDGQGSAPYGPAWGGALNPVLGGLVLLGVAGRLARWRERGTHWLLAAAGVGYLPALLTPDVEIHRIIHWWPLSLLLAVEGLGRLALGTPARLRKATVAVLLLASAALDLHHYFGPYQDPGRTSPDKMGWRHPEWDRAYRFLEAKDSSGGGPTAVLAEFTPFYNDPTFYVATRRADVLPDLGRPAEAPRGVFVVCDSNYLPHLKARFPEGDFRPLSPERPERDYNALAGHIPVTDGNRAALERWMLAEQGFRWVERRYQRHQPGRSREPIASALEACVPLVRGDPFLASVLAEKTVLHHSILRDLPAAVATMERALREGVPAAHLWNELGTLRFLSGDREGARRAFLAATRCGLDRTPARENLERMGAGPHPAAPSGKP